MASIGKPLRREREVVEPGPGEEPIRWSEPTEEPDREPVEKPDREVIPA